MNRRNFLKSALYSGITIITSKGIVFPEKKIYVPRLTTVEFNGTVIFDSTDKISWATHFHPPVHFNCRSELIPEIAEEFIKRKLLKKIDEKSIRNFLFGDWKSEQ